MPRAKKRITLAQAERLYPNEFVVFCDPKMDEATTSFIDGVVLFHCADQQEMFQRVEGFKEHLATFYTGTIPYRTVRLFENNAGGKKVA